MASADQLNQFGYPDPSNTPTPAQGGATAPNAASTQFVISQNPGPVIMHDPGPVGAPGAQNTINQMPQQVPAQLPVSKYVATPTVLPIEQAGVPAYTYSQFLVGGHPPPHTANHRVRITRNAHAQVFNVSQPNG